MRAALEAEHAAIIDRDDWEKVHAILTESPRKRAARTRADTPALLRGLLYGPDGAAFSPTHTRKGGRLFRSRNNARAAAIALAQGRRQKSTILWRASEDGGMVPFQGDRSIGFFDCLLSSPQLLRSSRLSPANKSIADTTWAAIEHASHTAREQDFEYERLRIDIRKASFARVTGFPKTAEALLDHVGLAIAKHSGAEILFREFQVESVSTQRNLHRLGR